MTISESLLAINTYPIPENTIEKICIERTLVCSAEFTESTLNYKLAEADVYFWLYTAPDIKEQEISFSDDEREKFLNIANEIYLELGDSKYRGSGNFGFIGNKWNG